MEVKFSLLLLPLLVFGSRELVRKYLDRALVFFVLGNFAAASKSWLSGISMSGALSDILLVVSDFFALFFGFYPAAFLNVSTIFLNLLLLIFLRRVFSLRSNKEVYKKIFDCGFWLGILFLFDSTTVIFGMLIFLSVGMFQKLTVRTLLIPVVGFVTPVFCYFSYCLWEGDTSEFSNLFLWYSNYNFEVYTANKFLLSTLFLGIISLISIFIKTPKVFLISGDYRT